MTTSILDLETDNLYDEVTKVHCGYTYDIDTKVYTGYRPQLIDQLIHDISFADCLIGHNLIGYDMPVLKKLHGFTYDGKIYDTMVAARLYNPDITGGHSLAAWGKRLGVLKGTAGDTEDVWSEFTPQMFEYCKRDVTVTLALFDFLVSKGYTLEMLTEDTGL